MTVCTHTLVGLPNHPEVLLGPYRSRANMAHIRQSRPASHKTVKTSLTQDSQDQNLGGVQREQKMLKGHLLRVIYHRVYFSNEGIQVEVLRPSQLFPLLSEADELRRASECNI